MGEITNLPFVWTWEKKGGDRENTKTRESVIRQEAIKKKELIGIYPWSPGSSVPSADLLVGSHI